ncbi:hypothetical protein SALBM217S_02128 [Streptomyces griseoloalbus]
MPPEKALTTVACASRGKASSGETGFSFQSAKVKWPVVSVTGMADSFQGRRTLCRPPFRPYLTSSVR